MFQPLGVVEVAALLDEIVAEYPPGHCYVRPGIGSQDKLSCVYTFEGQPSCLIGILLKRLGYTIPEASELNVIPINGVCDVDEEVAALFDGVATVRFLRTVQSLQDGGLPWVNALNRAKLDRPDLFPVRTDDGEPNAAV